MPRAEPSGARHWASRAGAAAVIAAGLACLLLSQASTLCLRLPVGPVGLQPAVIAPPAVSRRLRLCPAAQPPLSRCRNQARAFACLCLPQGFLGDSRGVQLQSAELDTPLQRLTRMSASSALVAAPPAIHGWVEKRGPPPTLQWYSERSAERSAAFKQWLAARQEALQRSEGAAVVVEGPETVAPACQIWVVSLKSAVLRWVANRCTACRFLLSHGMAFCSGTLTRHATRTRMVLMLIVGTAESRLQVCVRAGGLHRLFVPPSCPHRV